MHKNKVQLYKSHRSSLVCYTQIVAPMLLIIGWRTRIAAFVYAFNILFATLLVHSEDLFKIGSHGGWAVELQALYFIAAVVLIFTGGGKYAVSRLSIGD